MEISIVIPAYNEEKRIGPSLQKIIDYTASHFDDYEIIVIDDGSIDSTRDIVLQYEKSNVRLLMNDINRGKGFSVKKGILQARYTLTLMTDSDLATPIEELLKFTNYINNTCDIVIASRNLRESNIKVKQPVFRQIMGKTFPLIVNLLVLKGLKDTQCGFKLFKTDIAKKVVGMQTFDRFCFDVEILFIAHKLGYKIREAPVVWIDKEGSTVNTFSDGLKMLVDLFRIKYNDLSGKYSAN
jgi:dolichyl-phosphate beta-glucosyltransferase